MHLIYEIANNHNGDVDRGLKIINELPKIEDCNIQQSIKLQFRDLETFIHPKADKKDKYVKRFRETELTQLEFQQLCYRIKERGFGLIITPFDEVSVGNACDRGVEIFKVASCSALEWSLHEEIAKHKKPVIVSTAGLEIKDIDKIVSFYSHRGIDLSLLHCVAEYPAESIRANLNIIDKLKRRYPNIKIGYSGHEDRYDRKDVDNIVIAKGAEIIERHVGIEPLNEYSIDVKECNQILMDAINTLIVCGKDERPHDPHLLRNENETLYGLSRKVYEDGFIGIGKNEYSKLLSESFIKNDDISKIREYAHYFKGMISEAGISIGDIYTAELSHHYGLDDFQNNGAFIISLINRAYCKKLICMMPKQIHPNHYHKIKEETFHVLSGDMVLYIHDKKYELKAGDIFTVERLQDHGFYTENGVIFEEVSTTHINGDSYYIDDRISRADPMKRKTRIEKL